MFLLSVLFISLSANVGAVTVGGVGGAVLEADVIIGNSLTAYPYPAQSSACFSNVSGSPTIGSSNEVALGALRVDVGQLRVPSTSSISLKKDIRLPDLFGGSVFRIRLGRYNLETNPNYPPSAPQGPISDGDNPNTYLEFVGFKGINVSTGDNGGYSDLTYLRSKNITDNEAFQITVEARGSYDYSPASTDSYPFAEGRNSNRYIDDVSGDGLSNLNTGNNGGYARFVRQSTNNVTRGGTTSLTVEAVGSKPFYGEADAGRYPTIDGDDAADDGSWGNIEGVGYNGINSNDRTEDDNGYADVTNRISDNVSKGQGYEINATIERDTYGPAPVLGSTNGGETTPCDGSFDGCNPQAIYINQVFLGDSYAATGDNGGCGNNCGSGYIDATSISTYGSANISSDSTNIPLTINHTLEGGGGGCDGGCQPHYLNAWIDWDNSGSYESDERVDFSAHDGSSASGRHEARVSITPNSDVISEGTVSMKVVITSDSDASCPSQSCIDSTASEESDDWEGEIEDYTVAIGLPDPVYVQAWFDWNQNGQLEPSEGDDINGQPVLSLNQEGEGHTVTVTDSAQFVPSDAKSGTTLLRVVRRDGRKPSPAGVGFEGEAEDYTVHVETSKVNSTVKAFIDWDQNGQFEADEEYTIGNQDYPNNVGTFTESDSSISVPSDAQAGSTLMRVVHQQGGYTGTYPDPGPGSSMLDGEYEDYTVHVEPDQSYVRAWVDWNNDGAFNDANEGPYDFGGSVGFPNNNGIFKVSDTITAPTVGTGARLLRVTHKQGLSPPVPAEGDGGWEGETEDYTAIVGPPGDISYTGNITLGDSALVVSRLSADSIQLEQDVIIDEDYADNTLENPTFGPKGEFVLKGQTARVVNVTGVAHYINFAVFNFPKLKLSVEYNPPNPLNKTSNTCGPLSYSK